MKKAIGLIGAAIILGTGIMSACTPAGPGEGKQYNYDITVWVGENTGDLTKELINEFNETNTFGVQFNATVEVVSESKAVGDASSKPADCADIFSFAQDQLARAVNLRLLTPLNSGSVSYIEENNDEGSVEATKIGDTVSAFPMTADNGYFMYYDDRVVDPTHVDSLEAILQDCKDNGKNFSMALETGSWYAASFFYATGCESEWKTSPEGTFTEYTDTFKDEAGRTALIGMQKILKSGNHKDSDKVSDFQQGIQSAVVVSGIWDYKAAKDILGDHLGMAPLPKFTVDGKEYQMVSYLGHKLMGVKPQSDGTKALLLQKLAMYLTNEESQMRRFEAVGWGPSNKAAAAREEVQASPALEVLHNSKTVLQGQYPADWWTKVEAMAMSATTSESDAESLDIILNRYQSQLAGLLG